MEPRNGLNGIVDWPKEDRPGTGSMGSQVLLFDDDESTVESAIQSYARAQELCNSNALYSSAVHR